MGGLALLLIILTLDVVLLTGTSGPESIGTDMSWPNCQSSPTYTAWGIVGVTGGLDFRPNPCQRVEAALFPRLALYMNTGWPGVNFHLQFKHYPKSCSAKDSNCLAYNYGYNAARYALNQARYQLLATRQWWLDVETENSWTANKTQNTSTLKGMLAAIKLAYPWDEVGFYSYPGQWTQLVGSWRPTAKAWIATGGVHLSDAKAACKLRSFTDGSVELGQYTPYLDQNLKCAT